MKHARPQTLALLAPLLARLRAHKTLVERTPGSFYLRSKAFLHFHEDPAGPYADVKLDGTLFARLRVCSEQEQRAMLAAVDAVLCALPDTSGRKPSA
jgi:hypothetical protein